MQHGVYRFLLELTLLIPVLTGWFILKMRAANDWLGGKLESVEVGLLKRKAQKSSY